MTENYAHSMLAREYDAIRDGLNNDYYMGVRDDWTVRAEGLARQLKAAIRAVNRDMSRRERPMRHSAEWLEEYYAHVELDDGSYRC